MSEEQPDDSEPTPERQAELRAAYEANVAAGRAPYADVHIHRLGELQWIMRERRWSGSLFSLARDYERANLRGANLSASDLRGADLFHANLSRARLRAANLSGTHLNGAKLGGADLAEANLSGTHLNGAKLGGADLAEANLSRAHLGGAKLRNASLRGANLSETDLGSADLRRACLTNANLSEADLGSAYLKGADFGDATLNKATLGDANLSQVFLRGADLSGAHLWGTDLTGADLGFSNLSGASLSYSNLSGASLSDANLKVATLLGANLSGADVSGADLSGVNLNGARMDAATKLRAAHLDVRTRLADVVWNGVPLTRLNWQDVAVLGEEYVARQLKDKEEKRKNKATRLSEYTDAVLANRQVATVLRSQGLNEHADRFAYHAQLCQRRLLRLQSHYLRWLGSLFLWLIAGYGYRSLRSVLTYVLVVAGFAAVYFALGGAHGQALTWNETLVVSLTAFHGRGFFATAFQPGDPQAAVAAIEAVFGLLIEITFIATFTNRFFAR